jgi:hypothetical protein
VRLLVTLLAALLVTAASARAETLSFLAFGDTGKETSWPERVMPQYRVGEAMAREDRRAPVQALLLLGDNFYGHGLREETLEKRVRENVAGPYCYFLMLTRAGREALGRACDRAPEATHPVPFLTVLGNHDVGLGQGVALQRHGIPDLVGNWLMPEEARSYELGAGVSLVLFHSTDVVHGAAAHALERALRESKGPWRIVAAHHPLADPGKGWRADYAERVLAAIEAAGRPVHLFLAGHQHSLQALRAPGAALHVVSGAGGAELRRISPTPHERLFAEARFGFVRVDATPDALDVTFFSLFGPFDRSAEPRARFRVTSNGEVSGPAVGDPGAGPASAHR